MGGKAAAAVIRERDKLVPIIFLTGETAAGMKESTVKYAPAQLLLKHGRCTTTICHVHA